MAHEVTYSDGRLFHYDTKIMSPVLNHKGYYTISFRVNGKDKRFLLHRLIATAFIPNPYNKPQIDHIDTNKSNNSIENLRWTTQLENMNNQTTISKIKMSMRNGGTRKSIKTKKRRWRLDKKVYQFTKKTEKW